MSLTETVPANDPSDFHNSSPFVPSSAVKKSDEPTATKFAGPALPEPALISFTIVVPPDVPSDFQSSIPFTGSVARKNNVEPTAVR